jgi:hypothetical protein
MKLIDSIKDLRIDLIDDARKFYKFASVWVFVFIGAMPSIYDGIAAMGWVDQVPPKFAWIIRGLASAGIVVRVLKKRTAELDDTDKAGA